MNPSILYIRQSAVEDRGYAELPRIPSIRTSWKSWKAKFAEFYKGELRRILLPRTPLNKVYVGPVGILATLAVPGADPVGGGDLVDAYPLLHQGGPHGVVPGVHAHLLVDICQVALDGRLRDVQLLGYEAV